MLKTIKKVARDLDMYSREYAVINRVSNEKLLDLLDTDGLTVAGYIPEDEELELLDIRGESMMALDKSSVTVQKLAEILEGMGV